MDDSMGFADSCDHFGFTKPGELKECWRLGS